jgi:hypothetical protein
MTIHHLSSFTSPSRWAEVAAARSAEATKEREPKPADKAERSDAERDGPRRSPLFNAIKDALTELVALAQPADAAQGAEATPDAPATEAPAADSDDKLDQAITEFARALMHALRDGRGPHGEGRGHHIGHAHGLHRHGWDNAAQRVEKLAQQIAPEPAAKPVEAPGEAAAATPVQTAPAELPVEQAEAVPGTEITSIAPPETKPADKPPTTQNLHVKIDLGFAESPWKSVHDDLIESFDELRRAIGGPETKDKDKESLEEQLSELLVALAVKLQSNELQTAALAPAGSLLSVVA